MIKVPDPKVAGQRLTKLLTATQRAAILPFTEQPADNKYAPLHDDKSFTAVDLFSLFTASIIKKESVFVR